MQREESTIHLQDNSSHDNHSTGSLGDAACGQTSEHQSQALPITWNNSFRLSFPQNPEDTRKGISHPIGGCQPSRNVDACHEISHTGQVLRSLQVSMLEDVPKKPQDWHRASSWVPIFLEVLVGRRVVLKVWTPDYQHQRITWQLGRNGDSQAPLPISRIRISRTRVQQSMFVSTQLILKHNEISQCATQTNKEASWNERYYLHTFLRFHICNWTPLQGSSLPQRNLGWKCVRRANKISTCRWSVSVDLPDLYLQP